VDFNSTVFQNPPAKSALPVDFNSTVFQNPPAKSALPVDFNSTGFQNPPAKSKSTVFGLKSTRFQEKSIYLFTK